MELTVHYSVLFNVLLMHDYSKSILIQIIKIHFNIILPYPQWPSEWTLSFPIFHSKICSRLYMPSMHATLLTHFAIVLLFLSIGTRWLMPRMYCSHSGLLY